MIFNALDLWSSLAEKHQLAESLLKFCVKYLRLLWNSASWNDNFLNVNLWSTRLVNFSIYEIHLIFKEFTKIIVKYLLLSFDDISSNGIFVGFQKM